MRLKATIDVFTLDEKGYKEAVYKYCEEKVKQAAKEFAKAALQRIPIRTGFVAGAFGTLAQLLGANARLNPIIAFTGRSLIGRKFLRGEYYYPPSGAKVRKTGSSGRRFATQPDNIISRTDTGVVFDYKIDITYFNINEQFAGRSPTAPWGAFKAGREAFLDYLSKEAVKGFPSPLDYLIKSEIIV